MLRWCFRRNVVPKHLHAAVSAGQPFEWAVCHTGSADSSRRPKVVVLPVPPSLGMEMQRVALALLTPAPRATGTEVLLLPPPPLGKTRAQSVLPPPCGLELVRVPLVLLPQAPRTMGMEAVLLLLLPLPLAPPQDWNGRWLHNGLGVGLQARRNTVLKEDSA